ncbi:MAG: aminomethyl-transferring glycine dehydrogenase subunit GcvPB [Actinomycetota bacterium]
MTNIRRPAGEPDLEPTLFEQSKHGRGGDKVAPPGQNALAGIPDKALRDMPAALPELAEPQVARHFTRLSQQNYAIDTGFYPLGSCTMKYNPKLHEWAARLPGFAHLHPLAPEQTTQGTLRMLYEIEGFLCEIGGMKAGTLQPAAGAHGELTAMLMVRRYHHDRGDLGRKQVIVPDSAHGTNPATASMVGFETVTIPSTGDGGVDVDALRAALGPQTAAFMLTNPSTLGLFEARITEILAAVHDAGALAYMDGANLNAVMGKFKPGKAGFDAMHFNLHKTFSTPHGGGGPGSGPVAVGEELAPYLPSPRVVREGHAYRFERPGERPRAIGRMSAFHGNAGVLLRAYAYIRTHGGPGLERVSEDAVLSANYLRARVSSSFDIPFDRVCKHEFVASARSLKEETGVRAFDVAKALLDHGFHPPTIYFPLSVEEAMLIEPTETETLETIDRFADALADIAEDARSDPERIRTAPHSTPVRRVDETAAARKPDLRYRDSA